MIENNINGIGVLINNRLSGIVSKTDVIKALASLK
jgi:CBS domain-containing protein